MISFNINIDIEILSKLDEESLFNIFLTNKYINNLSKNDELWILRINKYFPGAYLLRTEDKSCKKFYILLSKFIRDINDIFDTVKNKEIDLSEYLTLYHYFFQSGGMF